MNNAPTGAARKWNQFTSKNSIEHLTYTDACIISRAPYAGRFLQKNIFDTIPKFSFYIFLLLTLGMTNVALGQATPIVMVNNVEICDGDGPVTIAATVDPVSPASGVYTYSWMVPTGVSDPGDVSSFTTSVAGEYSVVVTSTSGSGTNSGTLTVYSLSPYTVSGGGLFGDAIDDIISLSGSETCVNYELLLDGASIGSGVNMVGTGDPLDFPAQTNTGCYTVEATRILDPVQISEGPHPNKVGPQMSSTGTIVWSENNATSSSAATFSEIYKDSGSGPMIVSTTSTFNYNPQISSDGTIVWSGWDGTNSRIYKDDGSGPVLVSAGTFDYGPQISSDGTIVWYGWDGSYYQIYKDTGSGPVQVSAATNISKYNPKINPSGTIIWYENDYDGSSATKSEIYKDAGSGPELVSTTSTFNFTPEISSNGTIVWRGWDGSSYQIFMDSGSGPVQVSTGTTLFKINPQISAKGIIVWSESAAFAVAAAASDIYKEAGAGPVLVSNSSTFNYAPQVSPDGTLVWYGYDGNAYHIYKDTGSGPVRVSTTNDYSYFPQILADGSIVWQGWDGTQFQIFKDSEDGGPLCNTTMNAAAAIIPATPTITCPANMSVDNGLGICGAIVTYDVPTANECFGETIAQTAGLASGETFPVGTTTNTFVVTDVNDNTATCSFDVVVTDNENPTITCPANISANTDAGNCTAVVTYEDPLTTDNCKTFGDPLKVNFSYTGGIQNFTVPEGVTSINVKAWGAGGGGGGRDGRTGGNGGGGAYASSDIAVTPGSILTFYVGGGGGRGIGCVRNGGAGTGGFGYGRGGNGGRTGSLGCSGGGAGGGGGTAIVSGSTPLIVASGGGGGGGAGNNVNAGHGGGGNNNGTSISGASGGTAGTSGSINGTNGLNRSGDGGAGGGGGGGLNGGNRGGTPNCDCSGGGGGGGNSLGTNVIGGNGRTPGNSTDTDICNGCAIGGTPQVNGTNGFIVLSYSPIISDVNITQTAGLASGEEFPIGITTNTFVATDASGNTETCSFDVTVIDNDPPTAVCNDITIELGANGEYTLTPDDLDAIGNGSCGSDLTFSLSKITFTCDDVYNSTAITPNYIGTQNQVTQSHGGGYNPNTNEFWYPQWSGSTVYRYDMNHNFLGTFNSGQNSMMQLWMDTDSETDYYTANWGSQTITKRSGNSTIWSYNIGSTAAAVSTDADYVYAVRWDHNLIRVLDKSNGTLVNTITLPGDIRTYGGLVIANDHIYLGGYAEGWSDNPNNDSYIHQLEMDGTYIGSTFAQARVLNMAFDGETMWISPNNNTIYGVQIADGNAYGSSGSGSQQVILTVTDENNNESTCEVTITIEDNIPPTIACPTNISIEPTTDDVNCQVDIDIPAVTISSENCSIRSTSWSIWLPGTDLNDPPNITGDDAVGVQSFPVGVSTITYSVIDVGNNGPVTCSFTVTVSDTEAPELTCPENQTLAVDLNGCAVALPDYRGMADVMDNCSTFGGAGASTISSRYLHTLAIRLDGVVVSWGQNSSGSLGRSGSTGVPMPVTVLPANSNWIQVAAGYQFSIALRDDGTLWGWGRNANGELGLGHQTNQTNAVQIGTDSDWAQVDAGFHHTIAIKTDGTLWAWGYNGYGQLANGNYSLQTTPQQIGTDSDWSGIAAGRYNNFALKSNNTLWAAGDNNSFALGVGTSGNKTTMTQVGSDNDWTFVSSGYREGYAIKSDGTLWSWGYNVYGQLGIGNYIQQNSPVQVGSNTNWAFVSGGTYYAIATQTDGTLWSWGYNCCNHLGLGGGGNQTTPQQVGSDTDWVIPESGADFTFALKENNELWSWGSNNTYIGRSGNLAVPGQITQDDFLLTPPANSGLGLVQDPEAGTELSLGTHEITITATDDAGNSTSCTFDVVVEDTQAPVISCPGNSGATSTISSLHWHTLAIREDGVVVSWGNNTYNALGRSGPTNVPEPVTALPANSDWTQVAVGYYYSLALRDDGTLWSWGLNNHGQLGIGNTSTQSTAQQVGTDTDWAQIYAGYRHTVGLKTDGTLWAWGYGGNGALGTGNSSQQTSPVQIGTSTDWASISAGRFNTFILKTDGTLWATGYNNNGALGIGSTTTIYNLTQIGTDTDWVSISSGHDHSYAIKDDGTLWAWGWNGYGQLGLGTFTSHTSPQKVGNDTDWASVSAGIYYYAIATRTDGTLWSWGRNTGNSLGLGIGGNQTTPQQIGSDTDWVLTESGEYFSFALKENGELWSWGQSSTYTGQSASLTTPGQITHDDFILSNSGSGRTITVSVDEGTCVAIVNDIAPEVAEDNCPGTITVTYTITGATTASGSDDASGTSFLLGETTVTYTVADASGNESMCQFKVIVEDEVPPSISCVSNVTQNNDTGECNAVVNNIAPTASSDNCPGTNTITYSISGATTGSGADDASGTTFNLGVSTVTYTITDISGNESTCSFDVTISDIEKPMIACPDDQLLDTEPGTCEVELPDYIDRDVISDNCSGFAGIGTSTISSRAFHTLAIRDDGVVVSWGDNGNNALGRNTTNSVPLPVTVLPANSTWIQVAAGYRFSLALRDDGTLWAWGYNGYGQLGLGNTSSQGTAVQVGIDTDWAQIDAGYRHTVAIKEDGTLWAWGRGGDGQLGTGNSSQQNSPIQIGTDTDWSSIAAGYFNTFVMKSNGTMWATGENYDRALGIGVTTTFIYNLTQIGTDTDWVTMTNGRREGYAIKVDGTLWGWGGNYYGQLGQGNTIGPEANPVQIGSNTNWASISGALHAAIGTQTDGTLWSWGFYNINALGLGSSGNKTTPQQIGSDTDWVIAESGDYFTSALKQNGELWSWGRGTPYVGQTSGDYNNPNQIIQDNFLLAPPGGGGVDITQDPEAGTMLSVGTHTVTLTATDAAGNSSSCTFEVTVEDNEAPTVNGGLLPGSTIIDNVDDQNLIASWLPTNLQFEAELLYTKTIDGASSTAFHTKVNGQGATITVIKLNNGRIIGGYAASDWGSPSSGYTGNNTNFLFSVSNQFKHEYYRYGSYQYNQSNYGPTWGGGFDLHISSNMNTGYANIGYSYQCRTGGYGSTLCRDDFAGSYSSWTIDELEVWKVNSSGNEVGGNSALEDLTAECEITSLTAPVAMDNCEGEITGTTDATLPINSLGTTEITWTFDDGNGNISTATQNIIITDDENPTIACPANISVGTDDNICGAVVTYTVTYDDNCTGETVEQTAGIASGEVFPIGTTTNTFVVTDAAGLTATCSFTVKVTDDEVPFITCADDVTINNTPGLCTGMTTLFEPKISDNCDVFDNGLNFGGPSDYIQLGDLGPIENWTIETWFKPNGANNYENLFHSDDLAGNTGIRMELSSNWPLGRLYVYGTSGAYSIIPNGEVLTDEWHHVAVVGDKTNGKFYIYFDGQLKVAESPSSFLSSFPDFVIGRGQGAGAERDYKGTIDNFRIWNVARTEAEIVDNKDIELGAQPGLLAAYYFNQGIVEGSNSGENTLDDSSGNGNNGTLVDFELDGPISNWVEGSKTGLVLTNNAPELFPVGNTTVTWTVKDAAGNEATCDQMVTVIDNEAPTFTRPADMTIYTDIDCNYDITVGHVGDVENEKDNCSQNIEASFKDATPVALEGCEGGFTIERTWSLKDNSGNSAKDQIQTITIRDNTVPTFTRPADMTIYTDMDCNYDITVGHVGDVENEKDNCSQNIEATFKDATPVAIEGCEGGFTIERTWSLKDNCGNSAKDQIQTITIRDNTVPTFTRPADMTIYTDIDCNYDITVGHVGDVENEKDNCSQNIEATFKDATPVAIEGCEGGFTIERTWSLKDNCGNSAKDQIQTITIRDNTVPTFTRPADMTIYTDIDCNYDITVGHVGDVENEKDNCSQNIEATFKDATPVAIEGCEGGFTIERIWSLKDNCGNSAKDQIQTITIRDNTVPTFTRPADMTIYTDIDCNYDITVGHVGDVENEKDNCSQNIEATFKDATPVAIEGCEGGFTIERTWSLKDNCGNSAKDQIQTITIRDNTVPTFTRPADMTIYTDVDCNYDITVGHVGDVENEKDNCSQNIEATFKDATPVAIEGCVGGFTIERTWSLKDNCGNSAKDQIQTITIRDNIIPVVNCAKDITIHCNDSTDPLNTGMTTATDNCDTDPSITYKDVLAPLEKGYTITRTWSVEDACGNSISCDQIITIIDCEVEIDDPCACLNNASPFNLDTGHGGDDGQFSELVAVTGPSGTPIPPNPLITWEVYTIIGGVDAFEPIPIAPAQTPGNPIPVGTELVYNNTTGHYELPFYHYDATGYTISVQQIVNGMPGQILGPIGNTCVYPNPVITQEIQDLYCPDDKAITLSGADPSGLDSDEVIFTIDGFVVTQLDPSSLTVGSHTLVMSWDGAEGTSNPFGTVDDPNQPGCIQTVQKTFKVDDTEPPVIMCPPNLTIECTEDTSPANTGTASATDNCNTEPTIAFTDVSTQGNSGCSQYEYMITRTWTATDGIGLKSSCDQIIKVEDNTPPVMSGSADFSVEIDYCLDMAMVVFDDPTAIDNCDDAPVIAKESGIASGDMLPAGVYPILFSATDACGNRSTFTLTITVIDPPILVCSANSTTSLDPLTCSVIITAPDLLQGRTVGGTENLLVTYELIEAYHVHDPTDVSGMGMGEITVTVPGKYKYSIECKNGVDECWNYFIVEDKLAPVCALAEDDEPRTTVCEMPDQEDPSGKDDLKTEIVSCVVLEKYGEEALEPWFDKLELVDNLATGEMADFTDCSDLDELFVITTSRDVDCNDNTDWGIDIPDGWRVCKVYTRSWEVTDWTGRRSEPCSQDVLIVSPIANTDNIIIDPKIEASCSASADEIPSGAPYFIDLDNSLGDMVTCPQTSNQKIEIPAGSSICKISTIMDMYDPTEICGDGTEDCSSAYKKVIRWTVLDECSDKPIYYDFLQLLEVYDREGPTIMDKQAWITPNPFDCTSKLNASFAATDDCSEVTRYEINVSYNMPTGHLSGGGLVSRTYPGSTLELDDIPNGVEVTVTYIAYDCCDNPSDMSVMVTTMDKSDPVCVADDELIVSLVKLDYHDNDDLLVHAVGARVDAAAVNEGSQDNCFDLGYEIRQVDSDGNVIQDFTAYLDFIYTDAEGILDGCQRMEWVDLKVYEDRNSNGQHDEDERYSICPSKITFTDRTEPMASGDECFKYDCTGHSPDIAPPTILWDPSECASIDLVSDETEPFHCPELVECNGEMIYAMSKRTIIHRLTKNTDHTSFSKDITQVVYEELVEDVEIKMPWDLKVDCNQEFDPGMVMINNQGCSDWSMSAPTIRKYTQGGASAAVCGTITYEYQFLNFCKMERWERVNNLTVDRNASSQLINRSDFDNDGDGKILNNGIDDQVVIDETSDVLADGFFRYIQIIKVIDNEAPTAMVRDTSYCDLSNDCFGGVALFEVTPMDDCSTSEVTEWYINEDDDIFFGFERTGNVFESTSLSKGIYELHYKVEDQCGNSVWLVATTEVMWDDCKKPTIICHGVLAPVMENGMLMITASSLVTSLTDNCSSEEFLSDNLLVFVPTDTNNDGDINEDDIDAAIQNGEGEEMVTLTCQRFGYVTVPVVVWTIDEEGNYQYCMTLVDLQRGTSDPCGAEPEGRVAGEIVNASDEMIGDVTVNVWSSILGSFADLFDGFFNFSVPMSSDASVEPKKDIGYLNGVSTADLVLMQKHILGIAELSSSYQMIAADVTGDNKINTRDMLHLSKLILGIYDELPNVDSWKFVPKDYRFANPTSPWGFPEKIDLENLSAEERADFVGIKMGDLSGNARPNSLLGDEIEPSEFLNVEILDARLVPNEVYPISFYAKSDINISGYQFTISLDSDVTLVSVEPGTLPNMDDSNFGKHKMEKGVLTTYWAHDQAIPMNGDEVLFTINVMAQQAVNLSDVLSINSSETKAEAYDDHLNILGLNLLNNKSDKARLVLYQNNPNPFSDITTIGFELPASDDITLLVRDIAGRTIKSISGNYPKGYNEIRLNSSDLSSIRGVLYYELRTSFGAPSKKMIIVE